MMVLTPVGLNMFITASTDSRFMPFSQPGGAKLCEKIRKFFQILKHTETALFSEMNDMIGILGKASRIKTVGGVYDLRQDPAELMVGYSHHHWNFQHLFSP